MELLAVTNWISVTGMVFRLRAGDDFGLRAGDGFSLRARFLNSTAASLTVAQKAEN